MSDKTGLDSLLAKKTQHELVQSLIAELAKSTNEIRCSRRDIEKASNRLSFLMAVANELINRLGDSK